MTIAEDRVDGDSTGQVATVWHEDTQSFYEAKLIRKLSSQEYIREALRLSKEAGDTDTAVERFGGPCSFTTPLFPPAPACAAPSNLEGA